MRTGRFPRTGVALAASAALATTNARLAVTDGDTPPPSYPAPIISADGTRVFAEFDGPRGPNINAWVTIQGGIIKDMMSGAADYGKWLCDYCYIFVLSPAAPMTPEQMSFVLNEVEQGVIANRLGTTCPPLCPPEDVLGPWEGFKTFDQFTVCNGTSCVTLQKQEDGSWKAKDGLKGFKMDNRKGYLNPKGFKPPMTGGTGGTGAATPPPTFQLNVGWAWIPVVVIDGFSRCCVTIGPATPPIITGPIVTADVNNEAGGPGGLGEFGGPAADAMPAPPACVHVDSRLPDGRRAGDIKKGDVMQLGDEHSPDLHTEVGVVSYSETKRARGFRVTTQSGISLVCSDSAPIWTDKGYIEAPGLLGTHVAVRVDGEKIAVRYEQVEAVVEVGEIDIQHITVGDRAFWAGEQHGAYLLHHNLKEE